METLVGIAMVESVVCENMTKYLTVACSFLESQWLKVHSSQVLTGGKQDMRSDFTSQKHFFFHLFSEK